MELKSGVMESEDIPFLLALQEISGLGPVLQQRLLKRFGTGVAIAAAKAPEYMLVQGISMRLARQIAERWKRPLPEVPSFRGQSCLLYGQSELYPTRLLSLADAPLLLFTSGVASLNTGFVLGVIGTRRATVRGILHVRRVLTELVPYHPTIVSGLAIGIDTSAHEVSLELGLPTVAVLGHGLGFCYPPENRRVFDKISERGLLVTELNREARPERGYFPMRNRIVAGLCDAILLVEAGLKGGALITVHHAWRYRRPVFAIPGRPEDSLSMGPNRLIADQKAHLLYDSVQIPQRLGRFPVSNQVGCLKESVQEVGLLGEIHALLVSNPCISLDALSRLSGKPTAELASVLLEMELNGQVVRLPSNGFRLL
jgi:DNA processing protein